MTYDPRSYEAALLRHLDPERESPVIGNTLPSFMKRIRDEVEVTQLHEADDVASLITRDNPEEC